MKEKNKEKPRRILQEVTDYRISWIEEAEGKKKNISKRKCQNGELRNYKTFHPSQMRLIFIVLMPPTLHLPFSLSSDCLLLFYIHLF